MKLTPEKKQRLKNILRVISTPEEKKELSDKEAQLALSKKVEVIQKAVLTMQENEAVLEKGIRSLAELISNQGKFLPKISERLAESFGELNDALGKNLDRLGGTITTSYEKNKPENAAGVYKDMINQLSIIDKSIKNKPVPVWNWPQYAGVNVRNKNFSNINPAVDAFNMGGYDYVSLVQTSTTDTYTFKYNGASGSTAGTIVITYTDSTKATISTVVKTPVNPS